MGARVSSTDASLRKEDGRTPLRSMTGRDPARRGESFDSRVSGISVLGEPVRRALYRYVVAQPSPVSRDDAAAGVGVARHVAKFHLDRLAAAGLLETEFRRPPGRGGPGAGRPAKLYRRSSGEVHVSLPERRYDLAGWLLAQAVTDAERERVPVVEALAETARDMGRLLGEQARRSGYGLDRTALAAAALEVLEDLGYEPRFDTDGVTLVNCPFHTLAEDYTSLVCGMNLDLIEGVLAGLGPTALRARLEPSDGRCCVRLRG
jgi:predicted ArsR family transcriptional regulator